MTAQQLIIETVNEMQEFLFGMFVGIVSAIAFAYLFLIAMNNRPQSQICRECGKHDFDCLCDFGEIDTNVRML